MLSSELRKSLQDLSKDQVIEVLKGLYDRSLQNKARLRGELLPVGQDTSYVKECRRKVIKAVYDPARKILNMPRFRDTKKIIADLAAYPKAIPGFISRNGERSTTRVSRSAEVVTRSFQYLYRLPGVRTVATAAINSLSIC